MDCRQFSKMPAAFKTGMMKVTRGNGARLSVLDCMMGI
jgi:hypothetical protein